MRKRILASILALTMVFTMMPATAFADEQVSDNTGVVQTDESTEAAEATEVEAENVEATETVDTTEAVEATEMGDATEEEETALAEESMEAGNEAAPLTVTPVTFKNDGYPYGKDMTSSQVTLVMEADGATSYQWMSASSKYGTYTNIEGATGSTYTINSPSTGTWYKCSVDGNESKAVETVYPEQDGRTWTKPYESWYISNGTMAYMVNRTYFDVTGLYTKNGVDYMLCTSFNRCWRLFSSTSANPDTGDQTDDLLDALRVSFNESDAYDIVFEADLADGHQAFSFGCDTQLGSSATSGDYYDYAALQALIKNGNLKQVSMIGSATVAGAQDDEPAFVIAPVTDNSMFWIGYYSDRKTYAYNNSSVSGDVKKTETINGKEVATLFEGGDSGMTMSWTGLDSGSSVKFRFCVGSVKDTGAINGKVNYVKETLIDLDPNTAYEVTCDGTTYTITSNSDGELALSGKDANGTAYDFVGKTITIKKVNGDEDAANIDVAGRPTTPQQPSDMAGDSSDTPELVDKIEIVEMTENSVSISPVEGQEYAYSTDGENWTTLTNANIDANGYYKASGLTEGGTVYIKTRISATKSKPASAWSATTELSLKQTIKADATGYNGTYDGAEHTAITVTPAEEGATVTYSTTADGTYSSEVPEIKDAGTYTVYYRVEKEGYYPSCGSVQAVILGYPLSVSWSSNTVFTYDGTSKLPTAELVGSPLEGEECSLRVSLSPDSYYSQAVEAGTYTACAYLSNSNYIISSGETLEFTINKANRDKAPELTGIAETISGKKDGKIEGLVAWDMEYRKLASSEESGSQSGYDYIYSSSMTFESGTYEIRYREDRNYYASPSTTVTIDAGRMLEITLPEEQLGYTITSSESQVGWDGAVDLTLTLGEGYHVDGDLPIVMANGEALTVTENTGGTYTVHIENIEADQTITVSGIVDADFPTGQIKIGDKTCNDFVEAGDINYDNIINGSLHVEINDDDATSGIKSREYYVYIPTDDKAGLSLDEVKALEPDTWTEGDEFDIDSDTKCVIYVKITDKSGNITYISSNGITVDNAAPVISGLTEGGIYCQNIEFTVTDANLKSVTYQLDGGENVSLSVSEDGKYVLPIKTDNLVDKNGMKNLVVTAIDGAGNDTTLSIKLGHEYTEMTFAPTVLDKGYTMYVCEHTTGGLACADTYKDNYVDALGVSGLVPKDKDSLESIVSEAERKLENDSLSDDDKAFYNEVIDKASDMLDDIEQAEEIITELDGMNIDDIENPTANDSDKLNDALTKINKLLDADDETTPTQSLTDAQKEELEKLRDDINDKLDLIADVADGLEGIEKGTSTEPGVDTINKITDINPADQKDIESVLSKLEDYLDKYEDNLTDEQKDKAESDYEQMLDKLKEAAKKDIDQKLESVEKQIEATVSDPEEKAEAISKAAEEAEKAKADIDNAQTRADVIGERDGGKENMENITGTIKDFREIIKDNIESSFAEKKSAIEAMTDLTDSEKAEAISKLEEEKQKVFETIDNEKLKDDIINSAESVESTFDTIVSDASQTDLSNAKANVGKAEEAAEKTTNIIGDIKASSTDKEGIIVEIKKELEAAGIDNADVDISDYNKIPATLHETGKVTGTVEITVGSTTKTVEIVKELPKLSSYVTYESTVANDAPKAEVSVDQNTLMEKLLGENALEALANGGNADIVLDVQNKDTEVTSAEAEAIANKLADSAKVGKYLDISLFLNVVDSDGTTIIDNERIHEPETTFTIKISVPKELIATGNVTRTYQIVRVHDGVAEILDSVYDAAAQTLTFETDRFSTYAIAYTDKAQTVEEPATPTQPAAPANASVVKTASPKTGDTTTTLPFVMVMLAGIGMLAAGRRKVRNR